MHLFDNRHDFTSKSGVQLKSAENIQYLYRAMGSLRVDLSDTRRIDKTIKRHLRLWILILLFIDISEVRARHRIIHSSTST